VAVATSVAAGGYLVQGVAAASGGMPAIDRLSPWHWYLDRNILVDGVAPAAVIGPLFVAGLLLAAGWWLFNRRDLR
jgi:hypothetical protein